MTATLRADDELQLATMLGVDHIEVLRMPSHRSDTQLILQVASSPLEMCNCLWDFIAGLPHARIIIFCMTIKEAEEMAEALKGMEEEVNYYERKREKSSSNTI